ncbi:MAG: beta-glucosidase, partial [Muribaculaceae bacterium]|nr:beta-glucosidase [Muribaculaceae bacterium]
MTLDEKVMQLNQYTLGRINNVNNVGDVVNEIPAEIGSMIYYDADPLARNVLQHRAMEQSRLGIPVLFGYDVIHGFRTVYPISLAQACSWNPELVREACSVAAQESRMSGVDWTFSPMIDVARDPRWGRVAEGYGEDPYANAVFCAASVRGYQGDNLADSLTMAACLKHYVGYGASEAGRDYVYTEVSPQTLWDTYLPPYQAGVEAGAVTLMSSFNDISGTPGSANHYTLTEILKNRWGHEGFVVSDWGAIEQLISQGMAADKAEATVLALNAGLEMDMMSHAYDRHLADLVAEGKVSQ